MQAIEPKMHPETGRLIIEAITQYRDENRRLRHIGQNMLPVLKAAKAMTHLVRWFDGNDEALIAVSAGELRALEQAIKNAEGVDVRA